MDPSLGNSTESLDIKPTILDDDVESICSINL